MKGAKEYLNYCTEHPEERANIKKLFGEGLDEHISALGFSFTRDELSAEIENAIEVFDKDLAGATGGVGGWLRDGKDEIGWPPSAGKDGAQCIGSCW